MKRLLAIALIFAGIFFLYKVATAETMQSPPLQVSTALGYSRPENGQELGQEQIKWMQAALNRCIAAEGLVAEPLEVDGHFGPASRKTTAAFQRAAGLADDGELNALTVRTMIRVLDDGRTGFGTQDTNRVKWTLETGKDNWTLTKNDSPDGAELTIDYSTQQTQDSRSTTVTVTDEEGTARELKLTTRKAP